MELGCALHGQLYNNPGPVHRQCCPGKHPAGLAASEAELQLVIVSYSLAYGALLMNGARLGYCFLVKASFFDRHGLIHAGISAVRIIRPRIVYCLACVTGHRARHC